MQFVSMNPYNKFNVKINLLIYEHESLLNKSVNDSLIFCTLFSTA